MRWSIVIQKMRISRTEDESAVSQLLVYRTVYNHRTDAFALYCIGSCQWPIKPSAIIALPVPIVQFSIYWVQLKSSEECPPLLRLQWPVYEIRATAREMPSFSTAYTVFSLPNTDYHPEYLLFCFWYGLCNLQSFEYGYNHLTVSPCVISLPDGRYLCFFVMR